MKQWNAIVSALTTLFGVRLGMLWILAVGLMGPGYAETVYTALSGGKTWTYTLDNSQNATIMGVDDSTGTLSLPAALDGHAVVAIGPSAFEGAAMTGVTIPDSVRSIGNEAFQKCISMTNVTVGNGVAIIPDSCFMGCTKLNQISLGTSVSEIKESSFSGCQALKEIRLPVSVKKICGWAFESTNLESVQLNDGLEIIGRSAFNNCTVLRDVTLPKTLLHISSYAFYSCPQLKQITIPNSVTNIGDCAFSGTGLKTIAVPDSVTGLGASVFENCASLYYAEIGDGVSRLSFDLFKNCKSLRGVKLGRNVKSIWDRCFYGCERLRYVQFETDSYVYADTHSFGCVPSSMVVYVCPGVTEFGEAWQGFKVKDASTIPDNPYVPYELTFCEHNRYPSKLFLTAYPDEGGIPVPATKLVVGNPIYCWFGVQNLIGEPFIENDICLGFYDESGVKEYRNYDCSSIEEDRFYVNGMEAMTAKGLGANQLTVRIDAKDDFDETDKENNTATIAYTVVPGVKIDFVSEGAHYTSWNYESGTQYGWLPSVPTRLGYKFLGWFTDEKDGMLVTTASIVPDAPTTLYAHWIVQQTVIVSSNPTVDTTWGGSSLYIVTENLTIPSGVTLILEPGVIVKFKENKTLTVAQGGTLRANGTRANPIVFTSINDDTNGGKTEGSTSRPSPGDWYQIGVSGLATFCNVHVFYNSSVENHGGLECYGGAIVFDNSEIAETKYECVNMHGGGTFTARNSIFRDSSLAFGYYGGDGVKVYNCVVANCTTAVRQSSKRFFNTIFYNCKNFTDQGGDGSVFNYCCFYNMPGFGDQGYIQPTCFWADPLFVAPNKNDFRLSARSPCIDAANGATAPECDYYGVNRVTVRTDGAPGQVTPYGSYPDIGISEYVPSDMNSSYDLIPTAISAIPSKVQAGDLLVFSWTVQNNGSVPIDSGWHDAVYLTSAMGHEVLLGEIARTRTISVDELVSITKEFVVPTLPEGTWYPKVIVNSHRSDVPEGTNTANNVLTTSEPVVITTPTYTNIDGCRGVLSTNGSIVLKFTFDEGALGQIAHVKVPVNTKVLYGFGFVPQGKSASGTLMATEHGDVLFHVPRGEHEVYVVLAENIDAGEYEITFEEGDVAVSYITPDSIPCSGETVVTIMGAGFTTNMAVSFLCNGSSIDAKKVYMLSQNKLTALVDCSLFSTGKFATLVLDGKVYADVQVSIKMQSGVDGGVWAKLIVPDVVREGREFICSVEYGNSGTVAKKVPLLEVSVMGGGKLSFINDQMMAERLYFLGTGPVCPYDLLLPSTKGTVSFKLKAGAGNAVRLRIASVSDVKMGDTSPDMVYEAINRIGMLGDDPSCFETVKSFADSISSNPSYRAVSGVVSDSSGMPCADVRVCLVNSAKDVTNVVTTVSDVDGHFTLYGLIPGRYSLSVDGAYLISPTNEFIIGSNDIRDTRIIVDNSKSFSIVVCNLEQNESFDAVAFEQNSRQVFVSVTQGGTAVFKGAPDGIYIVSIVSSLGRIARVPVLLPVKKNDTIECYVENSGVIKGWIPDIGVDETILALLSCPNNEILQIGVGTNGTFEVDRALPGTYGLVLMSDNESRKTFYTNFSVTASSDCDIVCHVQNVRGEEVKVFAFSDPETVDEQWTEDLWNIQAIDAGKEQLLIHKNRIEDAIRRLRSARGASCCNNPEFSRNKVQLQDFLSRYQKEVEELDVRVKRAEAGTGSELLENLWNASKDYCNFVEKLVELRLLRQKAVIRDNLNKASTVVNTMFKFLECCAKDKDFGETFAVVLTDGDDLGNDLNNFLDGISELSQSEWNLQDTTKTKAFLKTVQASIDAYLRVIKIAKLVQHDPRYASYAKAILAANDALGEEYFTVLEATNNALSFVLNLEKIGTDHTLRDWGLLRDAIRKQMAVLIKYRNQLSKLLTTKSLICNCGTCGSKCKCHKPKEPMKEVDEKTPKNSQSWDPNEISGPLGTGDARRVLPGEWMTYTVYFENLSNATASAAEIYVKNPLSQWLDWTTFEMGNVAFNNQSDSGLVGVQRGESEVALNGTEYFVRSQVDFDEETGVVNWYLRAYDKNTFDTWPKDITAGILPPNDEMHCGEGHLTYRVKVRKDAPRNAIIENRAEIVFDYNPMIPTNPNWWNTVGSEATGVQFTESEVSVSEGEAFSLAVAGGTSDTASSVQIFLSYQTAAAADLDLAKGMIDGVVPKGGLKFPLILNWAAGEVTNRVITIPVKADRAVEDDEVLTFQLAAAQGQDIGEASVCTVTLVDANTAVTLQDGAMSATVKLTSKATKSGGAWNVAPGNMLDPDGSRGLYHAESPVLAPGGRSMLSAGPLSSGYLYFRIRFTGPVEEEKPSTVTVYRGNSFIGVVGHGTTLRDGWKVCASNDWNGVKVTFSGRGPINLVFTQGSDPTVHAEISCLRYDATDKDLPVYKILVLPSDPSGGHVTGAGLYTKGAVVPLSAKPKPGWEFTGWYTYGTNETRRLWDNKANVSGKVVGDFEVFAEFVRMPYIRALADPADGGKASGSGYCAAGKKVALKATASRNFTFAGWYAAGAPDAPVATTPTLVLDRSAKPAKSDARQTVLTDVDGDATYFARFVGDPEVSVTVSATDGRGAEPAGKGAGRYVAGTVTGAGRYAPGKKAVLKATANRGYVFAGWREAGADGTLSRSAAYTIGAMPPDDVALVAAFVTADEDRESVAASLGGLPLAPWVSKTETHALATNVRAGVYLEWPLAASALSETTVKVAGLPAGLRFAAKPVTSRSGTGRSAVLVTNIPANTVYGAPTAASRTVTDRRTGTVTVTPSAVKVTVTTAGRSSRTYQIDTTVDPLPAWAQGTFSGVSYADADGAETNGLAAVSVTAAGKVSAKQTAAGRAASFTAPWYDRHDAAEDAYHATLTAKVGAAVVTNRIAVYPAAHVATDAVPAETALGVMRGDLLDAWQTDWRREPWKGFAAALARTRPPLAYAYEVVGDQPGTVALKFGANGAVTAAGTFATGVDARGRETTAKASCSATLLPQGGDRYLVFVYFPPKGTFRGHARCLALVWDGEGFAEDVAW